MQWNHLPVAGGIYDQDPKLLDFFEMIFSAQNAYERQEASKREAEINRSKSKSR